MTMEHEKEGLTPSADSQDAMEEWQESMRFIMSQATQESPMMAQLEGMFSGWEAMMDAYMLEEFAARDEAAAQERAEKDDPAHS